MAYVIACIVGLVMAVGATLLLMALVPSLENHIGLLIFIFILAWGASIWLCKIAWWIGIVIAIIAFIAYAIKKKKPLDMESDVNAMMQNSEQVEVSDNDVAGEE